MNERIKQLIKQCYETGPIGRDGWPEYSNLNEEKFAQLIVRECMEQVWYDREAIVSDRISESIKERICQHFGVEE